MDAEKLAQLEKNFAIFRDMIAEIFSVSTNEDMLSVSFTNPSNLIMVMSHRIVLMFNAFTKTDIYQFIVGLAIISIILYFVVGLCEENNIYRKIDILSSRIMKKIVILTIVFILIISMHAIIYTILSLFRFVVYFILDVTDHDSSVPSLIGTFDANEIAYKILDKEKVFDGSALIDETIARTKESGLRNLYFIPWLIAWVSNLGLVIVVLYNSILILIYSGVYVLSLSDIILGLRKSRFLAYTKNIISLAFRFTIISLILYFFRLTCYPYLNKMLSDIMSADTGFFKLAMMFVSVRTTEFLLIFASGLISKKVFGVK